MRIPKRYGASKIDDCPFCGKVSTIRNPQDIPVCQLHKTSKLQDQRCICGKWLELKSGKWGAYFNCISCGNVNFKKVYKA